MDLVADFSTHVLMFMVAMGMIMYGILTYIGMFMTYCPILFLLIVFLCWPRKEDYARRR